MTKLIIRLIEDNSTHFLVNVAGSTAFRRIAGYGA